MVARIQAEQAAEIGTRLACLLLQPVHGILAAEPDVAAIIVDDWVITIGGLTPTARSSLRLLAGQPCRLAGSGRYGKFWWIAISEAGNCQPGRYMLLASYLRLDPTDRGSRCVGWSNVSAPKGPELLSVV